MKVYVYISQWDNGEEFEGSVYAKVFTKLEEAQALLNMEAEQAIESIKCNYYEDYWEEDCDDKATHRLISDSDEYRDWWEGTITEQELN